MARQPRTPGAAEATKATETEVVTPTTAANADANLDAILGTAETPENTGAAEATSTVSEPVAKRTRQVCGPHGWTTEEY